MGVHIFTKSKNTDVWKKKKRIFWYSISEIPNFFYMNFFQKMLKVLSEHSFNKQLQYTYYSRSYEVKTSWQ